jgi:pantoate--beta-alanine ligase
MTVSIPFIDSQAHKHRGRQSTNGVILPVQLIQTVKALLSARAVLAADGAKVALVPTMGALHAGHMALVEAAKQHADRVIVSIFVNPKQFGPSEDLDAYPRPADADTALLKAAGVEILWMPPVSEVYPQGFATTISVAGLPDRLCGAARPGHFDGVTTVVAKLFLQTRPDLAVFGEKDWQQLAIIRRMTTDLNLGVSIIGLSTQRDTDGLALSSRNAYLSVSDRANAVALPRALLKAASSVEQGQPVETALAEAKSDIIAGGFKSIDYVELVDAESLAPMPILAGKARVLAAARIGTTRLIDNFPANPR